MNSNQVLKKIMTLLSMENTVELVTARLADGTLVESDTFDVGQEVFVVSEDGERTPAPNGEHELELRDEEGNEVRIKIFTEDGVITERENVELPESSEGEEVEMEEEIISVPAENIDEIIEKLSYRVEELEKKVAQFEVSVEEVEPEVEEKQLMEEDLPKLDGAPVDFKASKTNKFNAVRKNASSQATFLSKLYSNF